MAVLPGTHGAISARAHTGGAAAPPALSGEAVLLQIPIIGQSLAVLRELLQQPALHAKLLPESRQLLLDHRRVLMTLLPGLGASSTTLQRMGVPKAPDHAGAAPKTGPVAVPAGALQLAPNAPRRLLPPQLGQPPARTEELSNSMGLAPALAAIISATCC